MSRVGKKPIQLPSGTTAAVSGQEIRIKGSKGELAYAFPEMYVTVQIEGDVITVSPKKVEGAPKYYGLARSVIANMVTGVSNGYQKKLMIHGVGYKAQVQGAKLILSLGYSHPVEVSAPDGIKFEMDPEEKNAILIKGFDKELVGQIASNIRGHRPPEPYKGKGIRYADEHIIRKAGKSASK